MASNRGSKEGQGPSLPQQVLDHIPQTELCSTALDLAWRALAEPIFNHSLRVFLIARWLARREASEWARPAGLPLLFVACVCHDLGASDSYNGPQRFEVEGADAARSHLRAHGVADQDSQRVWTAIAVHASPGIAERIDPLSRLVRLAVKADFSRAASRDLGADDYAAEIETHLPRLDVEKALGDAVVGQAGHGHGVEPPDSLTWPSTEKHPAASWPGLLLRAHLQNPGFDGVNPAF